MQARRRLRGHRLPHVRSRCSGAVHAVQFRGTAPAAPRDAGRQVIALDRHRISIETLCQRVHEVAIAQSRALFCALVRNVLLSTEN